MIEFCHRFTLNPIASLAAPPIDPVIIMFSMAVFSFDESAGQGYVDIVANTAPSQDLTFIVTGGIYVTDGVNNYCAVCLLYSLCTYILLHF